jgi:hypothetical protein
VAGGLAAEEVGVVVVVEEAVEAEVLPVVQEVLLLVNRRAKTCNCYHFCLLLK